MSAGHAVLSRPFGQRDITGQAFLPISLHKKRPIFRAFPIERDIGTIAGHLSYLSRDTHRDIPPPLS